MVIGPIIASVYCLDETCKAIICQSAACEMLFPRGFSAGRTVSPGENFRSATRRTKSRRRKRKKERHRYAEERAVALASWKLCQSQAGAGNNFFVRRSVHNFDVLADPDSVSRDTPASSVSSESKKFPRLAPVSPEIKPRLSPIAHFSRRRSKHRRETKQMSCFSPNIVLKHCFTRESCSWEFLFNDLRK